MSSPTMIYLVRHAESAPSAAIPESDWPLSPRGVEQAAALVPAMRGLGIHAIYSSPYLRARHTVAPLADALGLTVSVLDAFRERALGPLAPDSDFRAMLTRYWREPGLAYPGGESNIACAQRVAHAVAQLAIRHRGETIAIASHGNALALYLGTIEPSFGFAQWEAMRNPDLFRVVYEGDRATWDGARLPTSIA